MNPKPPDYRARRQWQLAARARGEVPECGREACRAPAEPTMNRAQRRARGDYRPRTP